MNAAEALEFRLLNDYQRDFPLRPQPYRLIAECLGATEDDVLAVFARLLEQGSVSRIGAVIAPRRVGASTLAALAAPADRLEHIAALVSRHPEVNHNYQREHRYNLWFVAAAEDQPALAALLSHIEAESGCSVLSLPLLDEYHIDLGFDLDSGRTPDRASRPSASGRVEPGGALSDAERRLLFVLQEGIELVPQPFRGVALRAGLSEEQVLSLIDNWQKRGFVKRFGVVVRHHELGFTANAMCVWDVPDADVAEIGKRLAAEASVTLCYRRARATPLAQWPYNLFCMIHGRDRAAVEAQIAEIGVRHRLAAYPQAVLFSVRRFKQRGARYLAAHA